MQTLEKQFSAYLQSISLFAYLFLIKQEFICEVCPAQADKHKLQLSSLGLREAYKIWSLRCVIHKYNGVNKY